MLTPHMLKKLLIRFASIVEIGTGVALLVEPRIVVPLLVRSAITAPGHAARPRGRHCDPCIGDGVLAERTAAQRGSPTFRGMLVYNVLIAPTSPTCLRPGISAA